ncbi:SRR1-like protein isoform X1 [Brevipalpus obovatus]|uniref:SRR1-like protein isoform X1 n=1 Tax=Brevipalpus obovatus TaxID=246614 RepID=UPI003D9DE90B
MDDFTVVTHKKHRKNHRQKALVHRAIPSEQIDHETIDIDKIQNKLNDAEKFITQVGLLRSLLSALERFRIARGLSSPICFHTVAVYGLGPFSRSYESLQQLALVKCLKDSADFLSPEWLFYDPIFSSCEREVLKGLGFTVLDQNDQGLRKVEHETLFYMPHCPLPLYHNLLWSNWNSLDRLIILGNSFNSIDNSLAHRQERAEYYLFDNILKHKFYDELPLTHQESSMPAFQDMSLHFFIPDDTKASSADIRVNQPPSYSHNAFSDDFFL